MAKLDRHLMKRSVYSLCALALIVLSIPGFTYFAGLVRKDWSGFGGRHRNVLEGLHLLLLLFGLWRYTPGTGVRQRVPVAILIMVVVLAITHLLAPYG